MNYTEKQFLDLLEAADDQGCEHLDELCESHRYEWTGDRIKPVIFPSCGNNSLFRVTYPQEPKEGSTVVDRGEVVVCAVDDAMGAWPRFGGSQPVGDKLYPDQPA